MTKLIAIDFAGTLIKPEIIEEANEFRAKVLERSLPNKEDHSNPEQLYKANREFVEKLTGINEDGELDYLTNNADQIKLSGKQFQNQIATNLFQIGMFVVAKKHKQKIFVEGLVEQLKRIKSLGYKLAIVSGVRTDIISGMFQIVNLEVFDFIFGQPPILGVSNDENIKKLEQEGIIEFVLGDKLSDLQVLTKAKKIFVKWGHASGGEEEFADFSINNPLDLENIIN